MAGNRFSSGVKGSAAPIAGSPVRRLASFYGSWPHIQKPLIASEASEFGIKRSYRARFRKRRGLWQRHCEVRIMNHRLQILPLSGIRESHAQQVSTNLPQSLPAEDGRRNTVAMNPIFPKDIRLEDTRFFRSWLVCDFDSRPIGVISHWNWNALAGLALAVGFSLGCWSAAGMLVAHFLR
jgi:hypothetical protein